MDMLSTNFLNYAELDSRSSLHFTTPRQGAQEWHLFSSFPKANHKKKIVILEHIRFIQYKLREESRKYDKSSIMDILPVSISLRRGRRSFHSLEDDKS